MKRFKSHTIFRCMRNYAENSCFLRLKVDLEDKFHENERILNPNKVIEFFYHPVEHMRPQFAN